MYSFKNHIIWTLRTFYINNTFTDVTSKHKIVIKCKISLQNEIQKKRKALLKSNRISCLKPFRKKVSLNPKGRKRKIPI